MDWERFARALSEQAREPLLVLDHDRRFALTTAEGARLLGRTSDEMKGLHLSDAIEVQSNAALQSFSEGVSELFEPLVMRCKGKTPEGSIDLCLKLGPLPGGPRRWYLAVVTASSYRRTLESKDMDYDLRVENGKLREVVALRLLGSTAPQAELEGRSCFTLIFGEESACEGCVPARVATEPVGTEQWGVVCGSAGPTFVHAVRADTSTIQVRVRRLPWASFRVAQRARVRALAERFGLSNRESDVLAGLMDGQTASVIADAMGISARTVRFHQSNLFQKLGVETIAEAYACLDALPSAT